MSLPLVIYHHPCHDGWCAAWIMHRCLGGAQLFPANYGDEPPPCDNRNVFVVDFSYPREQMIEMRRQASDMLVLDHHKTSKAACEGLDFCQFDMDRSGARMAFDWCTHHSRMNALETQLVNGMRIVMRYVEDRDLFRNRQDRTKQIVAAIRSYKWELAEWDSLAIKAFMHFEALFMEGEGIQRQRERLIEMYVGHARDAIVAGYKVPIVSGVPSEILSDVVGQLAKGQSFAMNYTIGSDGVCYCGLRSDSMGLDVSDIAAKFGGGGHERASGFKLPAWTMEEFNTNSGIRIANVRP